VFTNLITPLPPLSLFRYTYDDTKWTYKHMNGNPSSFNYRGVSLAEELLRLGYVVRIFQAIL
jgi:hypothetical protein